jgi:hypothetical protein
MSLCINVGILAYRVAENDKGAIRRGEREFAKLNKALRAAGLPPHREPRDLNGRTVWWRKLSLDNLHKLRRLAAHLRLALCQDMDDIDVIEDWPPPWDERVSPTSENEPALAALYDAGIDGLFAHLCWHNDGGGYYVPIDFEDVLCPPDELLEAVGGYIGSTQQLKHECEWIAGLIGLPLGLEPRSKPFKDIVQTSRARGDGWWNYPDECEACLTLHQACRASLEMGAAIVFRA